MTHPQAARPVADHYPSPSYAWYVVGVLVMTTILSYTDRQILSLLVDPIRADLAISDTQVGLLLGTAFAVVYGLAGLPFGYLADRISRKRLIILGIILWSIGTITCGLAQSFTQLFIARMVVGIGEAVLTPASISMISDYFPPQRRGAATGVFLMGIAIGAGGAILFGGLILQLVESGVFTGTPLDGEPSWRLVLLFLGALGALPSIFLTFIREPKRHHDSLPLDVAPVGGPALKANLFRQDWPRLLPLLMGVATISLVDNAVLAWSPSLLIREYGMAPSHLGPLLGALLMVGGGVGVLSGGFIGDWARARVGNAGRIYVCLVAGALVIPMTWLINHGSINAVLAGVTLYIMFSGAGTASGIAAILDAVPNQKRGFISALSFFLNVALGAGVGPLAVAVTAEHLLPKSAGLGLAIMLVASIGFCLVLLGFYLALRNLGKVK